jgi:hypothetical protein
MRWETAGANSWSDARARRAHQRGASRDSALLLESPRYT